MNCCPRRCLAPGLRSGRVWGGFAITEALRPEIAEPALVLLDSLELPTATDQATYRRAIRLAVELGHHLFDTLYHAVALERDAVLVTADTHYLRKAHHLGAIVELTRWAEASR